MSVWGRYRLTQKHVPYDEPPGGRRGGPEQHWNRTFRRAAPAGSAAPRGGTVSAGGRGGRGGVGRRRRVRGGPVGGRPVRGRAHGCRGVRGLRRGRLRGGCRRGA